MTEAQPGEFLTTYRGMIYPKHLDHMGHMNVQHYVEKFDEGVWHLFAALGVTSGYIRDKNRGMAAVEMNIRYKQEMFAGDLVVVRSGLLEIKDKSLRLIQEMLNGETGEVTAIEEVVVVHLDRKARKAIPFPAEIVAKARERIVDYPEA